MDDNRRQIAAELVKIEAAVREMIYPLRTDALAIVREAAKRIEHLNELDGGSQTKGGCTQCSPSEICWNGEVPCVRHKR